MQQMFRELLRRRPWKMATDASRIDAFYISPVCSHDALLASQQLSIRSYRNAVLAIS